MGDPELQLAIAACRAAYGGKAEAVEPSFIAVDWSRFLDLANRHRIQALCCYGLGTMELRPPGAVADMLSRQASAIVEKNLRAAAESARLLAMFDAAAIPLLFLKGLTLGAIAYPDPFLKMAWDIDLLVAPDQIHPAARTLRSAGYKPLIPADAGDGLLQRWHGRRKESVWYRPEGGFHVDLHTRVADHPRLLADIDVNSPMQRVAIGPRIQLPTLARDELFAYLTVHGASSAWFRLKWITDLAAFLHGETADEIERLYDRSQQLGAGRATAQALLLGERLYSIGIGERLLARLNADPVNRSLAALAERQLAPVVEPTERPLGTAAIHLSQLLLLPGWRFKASELVRQLKDMAESAG